MPKTRKGSGGSLPNLMAPSSPNGLIAQAQPALPR